jgi:hypothetical protein
MIVLQKNSTYVGFWTIPLGRGFCISIGIPIQTPIGISRKDA